MIRTVLLLTLIHQSRAADYNFTEYKYVSRTLDGEPCLTGCSSESECVINWDWVKKSCHAYELAPIHLTVHHKDPYRKYCLSNCGRFGQEFDWCISSQTTDLKWDYCSSKKSNSFLPTGEPVAHTRYGKPCIDSCHYKETDEYYWCRFLDEKNEIKWEYCAFSGTAF